MKPRYAKLGVYHHNCWYTKAINRYPHIAINEVSQRTNFSEKGRNFVSGAWRFMAPPDELPKILSSIRADPAVSKVKKLTSGNNPLVTVAWNTPTTVFDAILNAGCDFVSGVYSQQGLETFDVIAKNFNQMRKILDVAEDVGQLKIFKLSDKMNNPDLALTSEQLKAITLAVNKGYYTWPRENNLEKISEFSGKKRRAFQENLRRAEAKLIPKAVEVLIK